MDTTHLDPAVPAPTAPSDPLHELRSLGAFRILRRLGEGGMGAVYLAYDEGKGQQVAIKVLADHLASNQAYIDRFYREARSGTLLNHPNIVRCLTVGLDRVTAKHYLLLEYVDGPSVQVLLERFGRLPVGDAVHITRDIARGLEHAHSRNIVHRDIKPGNILITLSGIAKLADLGLAKRTDEASHLTATRQSFGTPHYMPYEQALNAKHADGRSDIYALGATLYHMVTGELPFAGEGRLEVFEKKSLGIFTPASAINPDVPHALDPILDRMLARDPHERYQTVSELLVDLERSRLAAPVPSFIDPDRAMQDPWVRAQLAATEQATRPDLEPLAGALLPTPPLSKVWQVRSRDRKGRWHKGRGTTDQIVRRIKSGHLRGRVEAASLPGGEFRPLRHYPEFRAIMPVRPVGRSKPAVPAPMEPARARWPSRRWSVAIAAGVGVALLAAALKLFI